MVSNDLDALSKTSVISKLGKLLVHRSYVEVLPNLTATPLTTLDDPLTTLNDPSTHTQREGGVQGTGRCG